MTSTELKLHTWFESEIEKVVARIEDLKEAATYAHSIEELETYDRLMTENFNTWDSLRTGRWLLIKSAEESEEQAEWNEYLDMIGDSILERMRKDVNSND